MTDISLAAACKRSNVSQLMVKPLIDAGKMRIVRSTTTAGSLSWITVDPDQFVEDLAKLPECLEPACQGTSARADGFCTEHAAERETTSTLGRRYGIPAKRFAAAIRKGQVRCLDPNRKRILLREQEFLEDLEALPECHENSCSAQVLAGSDWCSDHWNVPGRERAQSVSDAERFSQSGLLPVSVFAQLAGVDYSRVWNDIKAGALPAEKAGRMLKVSRDQLPSYRESLKARPYRHRGSTVELAELRAQIVELAEQGLTPAQIGERVGRARNTVATHLDNAGFARPRRRSQRKLGVEERAAQRQRARELQAAGLSPTDIAAALGVSRTQVAKYLRDAGEDRDRCDHCGDAIASRPHTPQDPDFAPQRYCSVQCARIAGHNALREELAKRCLRSVVETAERLDLSTIRVWELARAGLLRGVRIKLQGQPQPAWGFADQEIDRFEQDWARGDGAAAIKRLRWQDPDLAIEQMRRMGMLQAKARRLGLDVALVEVVERARIERRRRQLANRRRGGNRASTSLELHARWAAIAAELHADLAALWELSDEPTRGTRPTWTTACRHAGAEDWSRNPADWPRKVWRADREDPEMLDRNMWTSAGDRVRKAIKRLQTAGTRIPVT